MKKHILFVDDETAVLDGLRRMLRPFAATWDCTFVRSAAEAIERIAEGPVDTIVCDVMMPGKDGFALLEELRSQPRTSNLPIVMLTGAQDRSMKRRALELGANDLLNKPVDVDDLAARLNSVLRLKAYEDELRRRNTLLENNILATTTQLAESQMELIWRLGKAAELRDEDTGNHVVRVGCFSAAIATELGMDADQVEMLQLASPLHDIGKIGIPDRILRKRGFLDETEWEIMKGHCAIGANILRHDTLAMCAFQRRQQEPDSRAVTCTRNPLLDMAARIARWHHERWDGSGYPDGLCATAIPIEARIVAVADAYDALTMERPYKPAYAEPHVLDILERDAGSHFDPDVHVALLNSLDTLRAIRNEFSDGSIFDAAKVTK
ncbi:MAG: response regulator [Phycisphaerales bacterium]|nr:response regulator [Phycisphaerales bacterium]